MENQNKPEQLQAIAARILQNLRNLQGAPSVQMHPVPADWTLSDAQAPQAVEDKHPDKRSQPLTKEGALKAQHPNEFAK
jgi:histone deacetylase 1/2